MLAALSMMKLEATVTGWPSAKIVTFTFQELLPEDYLSWQKKQEENKRFAAEAILMRTVGRFSNYGQVERMIEKLVGEDLAKYVCEARLRELIREQWPDFTTILA